MCYVYTIQISFGFKCEHGRNSDSWILRKYDTTSRIVIKTCFLRIKCNCAMQSQETKVQTLCKKILTSKLKLT
ncbi:hypothetical protein RclHR1_09280003 [Rhizophagus clarus]|uniref:Uncharacterized protein n=1 Tax=Rhizophagus clarus TaxID=94130 RepID=A0A2Z6SI62_9GLOM|nr:hypothetical protein RclHR1_09280003 [Rhizophagus clarus]